MGCDIHAYIEQKEGEKWACVEEAFDCVRCYGLFAFLTGGVVRNYSGITSPFGARGLPPDVSDYVKEEWANGGCHTPTYVTLDALEAFDYDAIMEDRRCTVRMPGGGLNGGATCEPGLGEKMTWKEFLPVAFFDLIARMRALECNGGPTRLVFFFDN